MVTIADKSALITVFLRRDKGKFKKYKQLKKGRVVEVLNKKFCNKWKKLTRKVGCWWRVRTTNIALGTNFPKIKKLEGG